MNVIDWSGLISLWISLKEIKWSPNFFIWPEKSIWSGFEDTKSKRPRRKLHHTRSRHTINEFRFFLARNCRNSVEKQFSSVNSVNECERAWTSVNQCEREYKRGIITRQRRDERSGGSKSYQVLGFVIDLNRAWAIIFYLSRSITLIWSIPSE